jgi:hypothetical protein
MRLPYNLISELRLSDLRSPTRPAVTLTGLLHWPTRESPTREMARSSAAVDLDFADVEKGAVAAPPLPDRTPRKARLSEACVKLPLFFLIAAPSLLYADGLSDVRGTLQKLQSDELLRARVEIKTRHSGGESDKQKQSESVSTVTVENGPDGLKLSWSPDQIRQSRKAAWNEVANPDAPRSDLATLKALEPAQALSLLDAADGLRRALEKAELREDRRENYQGKPARVLVFRIELGLNEEERKALKSSESYLKLWLDGDGVPLAMERDVQAKFSRFLVGFRIHEHDTRTYQRAGGRLAVTHSTHETSGAGLGHTEEVQSTINVTLLP